MYTKTDDVIDTENPIGLCSSEADFEILNSLSGGSDLIENTVFIRIGIRTDRPEQTV